jgi:hypothetical protein
MSKKQELKRPNAAQFESERVGTDNDRLEQVQVQLNVLRGQYHCDDEVIGEFIYD